MSKVDLAQFHKAFYEESLDGLDAMEQALLALDEGAEDPELINVVFRAAHSIKGGAATFGFTDVAAFTHVAENLMDEVRSGRRPMEKAVVELLLRSGDTVRDMLSLSMTGQPAATAESQALLAELSAMVSGVAVAPVAAAKAAAPAEAIEGWDIAFRPFDYLLKSGNDPARMFRELEALGPLAVTCDASKLPALADMDAESSYLGWTLSLDAGAKRAAVEGVFDWVDGDCDLTVTPRIAAPAPVAAAVAAAPVAAAAPRTVRDPAANSESSSVRVGIEKIDTLINLVGELVITQSMLSQFNDGVDASQLEMLRHGLAQLGRHTRELQESVMSIRMLPISTVFNRFPRLVRDLAQKLDKKVVLDMRGETTELDKTVLEKIGDPLVHLVRNAIDHGLEMPDKRLAAGKGDTGTLRLEAFHRGGSIVVEVADNGAGLNREAIVAKAIQRGIIATGEGMSDEAVSDLIFEAGFSTAAATTDLSGRGVGMDVVRRNVMDLGGTVAIRSVQGSGTTFTITLPLTLAIIDGLTAAVGEEIYIVPLVSIIESVQVKPDTVRSVAGGGELFRFRDNWMPIVRLFDVFGCAGQRRAVDEGIVIVVEGEGTRIGLFVDELIGQQQAVVKSLEANYRRVTGISGATILADGSVALIADVTGLVRMQARRKAA
ncbi:two-component system chemotaxis sensor kinase CheA [Luteibacter sp. OK325]|jgi:two-component system chemotaxis sensor kinase CheA|uniref:chemotaxis protein CheA n=1 Tax=Luteibacter sp. OK325 TaxID=2135670 RepID=UPI000D37CD9B|nr:chemotaxis protein CheA [Luteibacter sp. OK325]PTR33127.1 two-component system chemotaxis sensor kinase CheA [Luteibacter sp. OK325]